jgi:hypothetical protein
MKNKIILAFAAILAGGQAYASAAVKDAAQAVVYANDAVNMVLESPAAKAIIRKVDSALSCQDGYLVSRKPDLHIVNRKWDPIKRQCEAARDKVGNPFNQAYQNAGGVENLLCMSKDLNPPYEIKTAAGKPVPVCEVK